MSSFLSRDRLRRFRPDVRILWAIAALLAAGVVAAALIPHGKSDRDQVETYIEQVNTTGRTFAGDYKGVARAYQLFTLAPDKSAQSLKRLQAAARKLTALRIELQQIPAPKPARRLRTRLIAFYRQQEAVGYELVGITRYVPELTAAERSLAPASAKMRTTLASATTPEKQAAALAAYGQAVSGTAARLRRIKPPPLFAASHRAQIASLRHSVAALGALQQALRTHDRARVQKAVNGLQSLGSAKTATSRTAVAAYNRHVVQIRRLGAAVEKERLRLNRVLG